jgi:L-histidine Nalpha-methyltransferase
MAIARDLRQVEADADGIDLAFRADVLNGLAQADKAIPARWFYDRRGSELFDDITRLTEYYPTRSETDLLGRHGAAIAAMVGSGRAVVEFGAGSATKTPLLIGATHPPAYVPLDISGDYLRDAAAGIAAQFPDVAVYPVEADFLRTVPLPDEVAALPKLGFFPGSTIGNMIASSAVDLLRTMRATLGDDAMLLIGMDRVKDVGTLVTAYDDAAGVTAAFNMNLLTRINRELGGDIATSNFSHQVRWNNPLARIEMHLVAAEPVSFTVAGQSFAMRGGETIHTENSHKYGPRDAALLLAAGGWTPLHSWDDSDPAFALILCAATPHRTAP